METFHTFLRESNAEVRCLITCLRSVGGVRVNGVAAVFIGRLIPMEDDATEPETGGDGIFVLEFAVDETGAE